MPISQDAVRLLELIAKSISGWHTQQPSRMQDSHHSHSPDLSSTAKRIFQAIQALGKATPRTLSDYLAVPLPTVQRHLRQLLQSGLIAKTGKTKGVRYTLPKTQK